MISVGKVQSVKELILEPTSDGNVPRKLTEMRKVLEEYVQGIARKKREAASYLLVFMVSNE